MLFLKEQASWCKFTILLKHLRLGVKELVTTKSRRYRERCQLDDVSILETSYGWLLTFSRILLVVFSIFPPSLRCFSKTFFFFVLLSFYSRAQHVMQRLRVRQALPFLAGIVRSLLEIASLLLALITAPNLRQQSGQLRSRRHSCKAANWPALGASNPINIDLLAV